MCSCQAGVYLKFSIQLLFFFKGKIKEHGGSILSSVLVLCGVSLYFDTHEYTKDATEFEGSITEILIAE